MKRAIPISLLAIAVAIGWLVVVLRSLPEIDPDPLAVDLTEAETEDRELPRVVRYRSELEGLDEQVGFALVLEADDGIPRRVLNLSAIDPELGSTLEQFSRHGGFDVADRLFDSEDDQDELAKFEEAIALEDLATRILPPIDLSRSDLESGRRVVVSLDRNYHEHGADRRQGRQLFSRIIEPSGAYAPLSLGPARSRLEGRRPLVDYGVEIGFVLLDHLFLDALPVDSDSLRRSIAYFTANDITDAVPILLGAEEFAAEPSSDPEQLPIGPWLVHGRHLDLRSRHSGTETADLWLRIDGPSSGGDEIWRQHASSSQMMLGPLEILQAIAAEWADIESADAESAASKLVVEVEGRPTIPAGSLVLTGSPPGSAVRRLDLMDRIRLRAVGNFSRSRARLAWVEYNVRHRDALGYLAVGDRVETRVQHLGRQVWSVVP